MAETSQITFTFREVVESLLKSQDIHEGCWGLYVKFGLSASNIGPNDTDLKPAAVIPLLELGLQKFEKETSLSVDAGKVNPKVKKQLMKAGPK
jgi:hypothetical protein